MSEEVPVSSEAPATPAVVETPESAETPKVETPATDASAETPDLKPETPEQAEKRGQRRFERRLDKVYREKAAAEAKAEFLEKQIRESAQTRELPQGAPRMQDFTDIQEYATAFAKFQSENAIKEHEGKRAREAQAANQRQLAESWDAKTIKADKKYDDFDEVVGEIKPTSPWAIAIMQADNGDDVAYYLGSHLKEAQRIAALDPVAQVREIGRLEAKLAAEPPKTKISKAPAPINPLSAATGAQSAAPSPNDDIGTWIKKRSAQVHGK